MKKNVYSPSHPWLQPCLRGALLLGLAGIAAPALAQSSFSTVATYSTSGGSTQGVAIADVNGDGRPDVVAANSASNNVGVLLNAAATPGTFPAAATSYPSGGNFPVALALGDVNGDGRPDIVVANQTSDNVAVLLNSASTPGTFLAATTFTTGGAGSRMVALGDLNNDGRLDIVVSNINGDNLGVLLNSATTPGTFTTTAYASGNGGAQGVDVGDVNGDGRLDIVVANNSSNTTAVLLNSAATPGTFSAPTLYSTGGLAPRGVAVGDVSGDGRPDIVITNSSSNNIGVLLNQAATPGTFAAAVVYPDGGIGPVGVALGDVNGDGLADISTANFGGNNVSVLTNSTTTPGTFAAPATYFSGGGPHEIALGDLNGDGKRDIAATNFNDGTVGILLNNFLVANPNLVVSTTQSIPAGTYNSITVTGTGNGTLAGAVTVIGSVTVQSGGTLNDGCSVIGGTGSFTLAAGATLGICNAAGITASGATGAVQVTGTRSFSTDASYVYNGTAPQVTGTGLPAQVRNLTTTNANTLTLSAPSSVARVLTVGAAGNFALNGQAFTLLSSASGTALVVNSSTGTVTGNATVQRYIDPGLNPGPGYRHYGSPVFGSTVADLSTPGFTPVVNPAYNSSATPGVVTPFPTVFAYDQSRLATAVNNYTAFDKGFASPAALTDVLNQAQGYAVNLPANQVVDFVGVLTNGTGSILLSRNAAASPNAADAGWQLMANPYPAPMDYSLVAPADRPNLDASMYVFSSTGPYTGTYRAYVNGVGGNPVLPVAQGFFVRVSTGQTSGALVFRNSQRLTAPDATPFQRPAADVRPLVELNLRNAAGVADALFAYAEAGATPAFDREFDALKLPNPTGLNLAVLTAADEALAIDGRPAFTAATVLPLRVGVPAAGAYTLAAAHLRNLPAGLDPLLVDARTGQTVNLRLQPAYAFSVSPAEAAAPITGRFTLHFSAAALPTAAALAAAQVTLYPNPAHDQFSVSVPAGQGAGQTEATLLNALGQVVGRQEAALSAAGTTLVVDTNGLAAGIYTLRMRLNGKVVAKRVVLQ